MNERIRNIVDHSKAFIIEPEHAKIGGVPEVTFSKYSDLEKFAELIVRECAKFLEANSGYDQSNNAWHPEPEDLLEHFGVEE